MAERNRGIRYAVLKDEVPILNSKPVLNDKEFAKIVKRLKV